MSATTKRCGRSYWRRAQLITESFDSRENQSVLHKRIEFLSPSSNAATHRDHFRVAHLLEIVRGKCRAESATAVKNHLCIQIRDACLDVALNYSLFQVNRARKMILRELAFFAH